MMYLIIIYVLFTVFISVGIYRNKWVYKERSKLLKKNFDDYMTLPSYNEMFNGCGWYKKWNIKNYINKQK